MSNAAGFLALGISSAVESKIESSDFLCGTAPRPASRWRAFALSIALHLLGLAVIQILPDGGSPAREGARWARRATSEKPLRIRIPEPLYMASSSSGSGTRETRRRVSAGSGSAKRSDRTRKIQTPDSAMGKLASAPAPGPSGQPRREFKLPALPKRPQSEQTLLQPEHTLEPSVISHLPEVFFWTPVVQPPKNKLFVKPGHAKASSQRPNLEAPPKLQPSSLELNAQLVASQNLTPSIVLRAPAMPIQTPGSESAGPAGDAAIDRNIGDPTQVLALSTFASPMKEAFTVPAGTQVGATGSSSGGGSQLSGESGAHGTGGSGTGTGNRGTGLGEGSGQGSGSGGAGTSGSGTGGSGTGGIGGSGGRGLGGGGASGSGVTGPLPPAVAVTRVAHSGTGVFDVVVQSSAGDMFPESAGILSGKPIFSVFLAVGGSKEWILQYCLPAGVHRAEKPATVVRIGNPSPLAAPYPRVTFRPAVRRRPGSHVMIHGFINASGRFEQLRVLGFDDPEETRSIPLVLQHWEFRPAMQDNRPVRVEVLLAVPLG